ncbi:superoxide dismutase family protein [Chelativorans composti]|jgi:Cu/Zn superoxide dismutase|uniref:Superoxide dismutase [Cu-Zn] n=1 Tax=Chelativorans composti TaxID=768533 RepID=A0ABW5DGM5_9HYPH
MLSRFVLISAAALAVSANLAVAAEGGEATASFVNLKGETVGKATLVPASGGGVLIRMDVSGLPAGKELAVHIHQKGSCDPQTKFMSAEGHFNPGQMEHGFEADKGPHGGDLPNQFVDDQGKMRAEILAPRVSLDGKENGVKGRAIVIHAKKDDYKSQPAGDAGDRIACAVIK